jgi:hypothetical protein
MSDNVLGMFANLVIIADYWKERFHLLEDEHRRAQAESEVRNRMVEALAKKLGLDVGRCPPFERECHTGKRVMPTCDRVTCWCAYALLEAQKGNPK